MKTVGFLRRFGAFVVDFIIIVELLPLLIGLPFDAFWFDLIFLLNMFIGFPIILMIFEANWQKTLGKRLFKIKTMKEDGSRIGYKEAIIRRASFLIFGVLYIVLPFILPSTGLGAGAVIILSVALLFFLDIVYIFRSDRPLKQRYFDKLAHTAVIYDK